MKLSRFSRVILACLLAFFVLLGLGAYISRSRYLDSLPLVQSVEAAPGRLQKSYTLTGLIVCDKVNEKAVYAPCDLHVLSVETKQGESAQADEVLIHFDAQDMALASVELELTILDLEEQAERLAGEEGERAALEQRKTALELEKAREAFAQLQQLRADDGLRAPRDVDLLYLLPQGTVYVQRGQLLARYIPFPAGKDIVFTLPTSALTPKAGTNITCSLPVYDPQTDTLSVQTEQHLPISRVAQRDDAYTFTVPVDRANVWLHEGEQLSLDVGYIGETEYPFVVPRSAVKEEDGAYAVFLITERDCVLGTQIFLRRQAVQVLAMDDERAVLAFDPGSRLSRFASGCADGMTVRLW